MHEKQSWENLPALNILLFLTLFCLEATLELSFVEYFVLTTYRDFTGHHPFCFGAFFFSALHIALQCIAHCTSVHYKLCFSALHISVQFTVMYCTMLIQHYKVES